ncbi:hypothetical protein HDU86_004474 [Geranomyces michiganensis]|nr:hypothetical protein HDU86_004474 [Geranomyces michiganensis]
MTSPSAAVASAPAPSVGPADKPHHRPDTPTLAPPTIVSSASAPTADDYGLASAAEPLSPRDPDTESLHSDVSDVSDLDKTGKLVTFLRDSGIPVEEVEINLHAKGHGLQTEVLNMLVKLLPESWDHVTNPADLLLERVSGAMTNCIYFVTGPARPSSTTTGGSNASQKRKILLRIYGSAAGQFIRRDREMFWLCKMSESGVAPKLLGAFHNGRFEEFLDSTTLTKEEIRDPTTSAQIAEQLYRLHQLIDSPDADEVESTTASDIWNKMRRWQKIAAKVVADLKKNHPDSYAEMRKVIDIKAMKREIDELEDHLHGTGSPLVFAHNDAQYGNILRMRKDSSIKIVDYEYSSINYRGYDFANHFCEWAADYHCATPHKMDFTRCPNRKEQDHFFNAYIKASGEEDLTAEERATRCDSMRIETHKFMLASHMLWGLWGVMQAAETEIDFDYVGYACERFRQYWKIKDEVMAL